MRKAFLILAATLPLAACGKGSSQADQLDKAAGQSDPAAAAELRNQADAIRDSGSDANVSAPDSPAQNALSAAGTAASSNMTSSAQPGDKPVDRQTGLAH